MFRFIFLFFAVVSSPVTGWACASCGCTLSPDWEHAGHTGFKLDLRYDYINQDQLRSGNSTISPQDASQHMSNGDPQEVETYTENRYVTLSGEYSLSPDWKVGAQIPYIIRHHSTLGAGSNGITPVPGGEQYTSNTSNLGDVRLFGRYQGLLQERSLSLIFGVKLPTGSHDETGISTDATAPGPAEIDRGLQPGSGTTDVIVGAAYIQAMNKNWDYFGEILFQSALNSKEGYRPGDGLNLNGGFRYLGFESFATQIQINARFVKTDTGPNSDSISTGGTLVYLSPGISVPVSDGFETYAFLQVPVYQYLVGVQLVPKYTASLGVRYLF